MRVDDQEDREDWERGQQKGKKHVGAEILSKCLCMADAKKQGLSKVWNLISAEKQGRKHWSSGGRGGGFIAMEFAQTSALQKHSWKHFQSPPFFFSLPFSVTNPGSAPRSTSTPHSILWLVCSSVEPGFWQRDLSGTYRVSHLGWCHPASEWRAIRGRTFVSSEGHTGSALWQ